MGRPAWVLAALFCGCAAAQQAPSVYHVGRDVLAPKLIQKQEPGYSDEARQAKLQGSVLLALVVGDDGYARNIHVRRSLGLGLDENAVTAVSQWRFDPATKEGHPVAVESSIEVNFRLLLDARTWYTRRANFATLEGDTRPVLLRAAYPSPGGNGTADVAVGFDLDERGLPINIHVDSSSAPDFENEITNVIREWRFQPAMRNGAPVPVHGSVEFARGGTAVTLPAPDRKQ